MSNATSHIDHIFTHKDQLSALADVRCFTQLRGQTANDLKFLKFALARIEYLRPRELTLETGRIISLLSSEPGGMRKREIILKLHPYYEQYSAQRKESITTSVNKLMQRTKLRAAEFGLNLGFCRESGFWLLTPGNYL